MKITFTPGSEGEEMALRYVAEVGYTVCITGKLIEATPGYPGVVLEVNGVPLRYRWIEIDTIHIY